MNSGFREDVCLPEEKVGGKQGYGKCPWLGRL